MTVQVGEFANFVGSHFWNFQDELIGLAAAPLGDAVFKNQHLNMDVLYRSGETQQVEYLTLCCVNEKKVIELSLHILQCRKRTSQHTMRKCLPFS